jgi:hypothetical protein
MLKINTKVAAAVTSALALGGFATQASAAYVEPWNVTGTETFTVRLGGATAQDKGIVLLMRRICALGTMTRVTSGLQSVNICQADGTGSAPIAAGTTLVLYKNSVSGSGSGVNPVADKTTIPFVNLASLTQAQYTTPGTCTYSTTASTVDFADFQSYDCGTNAGVTNIAPDAGISDVEPALLGWVSGVNGAIDTFAGPQVIFGVPVSKNFRDALQTAQSSNLGGACVGSDSEACMPSLTFGQISSFPIPPVAPLSRSAAARTGPAPLRATGPISLTRDARKASRAWWRGATATSAMQRCLRAESRSMVARTV